MVGIGFHSFIDGVVYSITFTVSVFTGALAAVGMVLHEFPEGIITYLLLLLRGDFRERSASILALLAASLTTPLGMLVSYPYVSEIGRPLLGSLLAVSAWGARLRWRHAPAATGGAGAAQVQPVRPRRRHPGGGDHRAVRVRVMDRLARRGPQVRPPAPHGDDERYAARASRPSVRASSGAIDTRSMVGAAPGTLSVVRILPTDAARMRSSAPGAITA